jgi:hypothetical protein
LSSFISSILIAMLRHFLKLILGPGRDGMNITVLITHEFEITESDCNGFRSYAKETAYIDHGLAARAGPVDVIKRSDLVVVCAVNGRAFEYFWRKISGAEANVV